MAYGRTYVGLSTLNLDRCLIIPGLVFAGEDDFVGAVVHYFRRDGVNQKSTRSPVAQILRNHHKLTVTFKRFDLGDCLP